MPIRYGLFNLGGLLDGSWMTSAFLFPCVRDSTDASLYVGRV